MRNVVVFAVSVAAVALAGCTSADRPLPAPSPLPAITASTPGTMDASTAWFDEHCPSVIELAPSEAPGRYVYVQGPVRAPGAPSGDPMRFYQLDSGSAQPVGLVSSEELFCLRDAAAAPKQFEVRGEQGSRPFWKAEGPDVDADTYLDAPVGVPDPSGEGGWIGRHLFLDADGLPVLDEGLLPGMDWRPAIDHARIAERIAAGPAIFEVPTEG